MASPIVSHPASPRNPRDEFGGAIISLDKMILGGWIMAAHHPVDKRGYTSQAQREINAQKMLPLYLAGKTQKEIAAVCGISQPNYARDGYPDLLRELARSQIDAEQWLCFSINAIAEMLVECAAERKVRSFLELEKRLSERLGYDTPAKSEVSITGAGQPVVPDWVRDLGQSREDKHQ